MAQRVALISHRQLTKKRKRLKMETVEKIEQLIEARQIQPTECFAVMASMTMIDTVNPHTGTGCYSNETLEELQLRYPGAERMTIEAFCKAMAKEQDSEIQWTETTREQYWDMLEVLPPAFMGNGGFMVGEPFDHHAISGQPRFAAYLEKHGKYLTASRPMTVREFKAVIGGAK